MELTLDELTVEQKLGMVFVATCTHGDEDMAFTLDMIRAHRLGAIWVDPLDPRLARIMQDIKAAADYPILICTDAENGFGPYQIAQAISLATTDNPALAYAFGKVTALQLKALGYNVVCNPVLDLSHGNAPCGSVTRSFGCDPVKVAQIGGAVARGMRDAGVLTVAKHYPGGSTSQTDTHMMEAVSSRTELELLDHDLYPYLEIMKQGHLCGIMTAHRRFPQIDPSRPASLSEKVIGILRDQGFDGIAMTDALVMMGIVLKYGLYDCNGLAIAAGNDLALPWGISNQKAYEALSEAYRQGVITDARLDEAVRRVLAAQHQTLTEPATKEISEQDKLDIQTINRDCIVAVTEEGLSPSISREGKHLFVILTETDADPDAKTDVDPRPRDWYKPDRIAEKLLAAFYHSQVMTINQFPTASQNVSVFDRQLECDDVVFVTFFKSSAYIGPECLTTRIIALMEALQSTNRISAVVHFGNPYVMEDVPHVPRILFGFCSEACTMNTIDVLCGDYPAKGRLPFTIKLK